MAAGLIEWIAKLFPSDAIVQEDGAEYMRRYYIARIRSRHVRFHRIAQSDDDRAMHDHPWPFTSLILSGGYVEHVPGRFRTLKAPWIVRHRAEDLHALELIDQQPAWTLVFTGSKEREWGFATEDGWAPYWEYARDNYVTPESPGRLFGRRKRRAGASAGGESAQV